MRKLSDSVVVITGASSGIGRAAALAFAERGGTVVLAARRADVLEEVAEACGRKGARTLAMPTDVTDEGAVRALARETIEAFGRIDVWVNNAGVSLFARFEEAPPEAFRQVLETNFFGYVHGARAVLPYFREQGSGVLINNASMLGKGGAPYLSAYASSKFAILGFSESLRQELRGEDVHVCTVLPASIDTPIFQNAGNYTGRATKPMNPVYPAELVAKTIVKLAEHPRKEVYAGRAGRTLGTLHRLSPELYERVMAPQVESDHFQDRYAPPSEGNLFSPKREYKGVSGGWRHEESSGSAGRAAALGLALAVPLAVGLGWYAWGRGGGRRARR